MANLCDMGVTQRCAVLAGVERGDHIAAAASGDQMAAQDLEGLVNMVVAMFTGFSMFGAGPRAAAAQRAAIEAFKRALTGTLLA